jgi:16S rRNA (guanine527-N7)-methyltransferase
MADNSEIITKYFDDLTPRQTQQFAQLYDMYADWNAKINVISRKDTDGFYEKHVLHSLGIAKVMPFVAGTSVLDIGTGGGFPGIPLAILMPDVRFVMVDSIGKKITVVNAVIDALGLKNATAQQARAEMLTKQYDFVVSRAVARLTEFCAWTQGKIHQNHKNILPNGILYLKGGDLTQEIAEATHHKTTVYPLNNIFGEDFFETKSVLHVVENRHH